MARVTIAFPRRIDLVEEFEVALPLQLRKHLPDGLADEIGSTGDFQVSFMLR
jgi:hypothetical protein